MAAGEAEAASVIWTWTLEGPHQSLITAKVLFHFGIAITIRAKAHFVGRSAKENRNQCMLVRRETNVEVPFVLKGKSLHATSDGMIGQAKELGRPDGIYGEADFIVAADPLEEFRAAIGAWNFDGEMDAAQTGAFFENTTQNSSVIVLKDRVAWSAVGIDNDGGRVVESARLFWPPVGMDDRVNAGQRVEAFLQQQAAGAVFVLTGGVAWPAGDENDVFVGGVEGKARGGKEPQKTKG